MGNETAEKTEAQAPKLGGKVHIKANAADGEVTGIYTGIDDAPDYYVQYVTGEGQVVGKYFKARQLTVA